MKEINEKEMEQPSGGAADGAAGKVCGEYYPKSESLRYLPAALVKCSNCIHYIAASGTCELK